MDLSTLDASPFTQFEHWFQEADQHPDFTEANACFLATANLQAYPSLRTVLLKDVDHRGFVFFTNYGSRKSQELLENPHAALLFYWPVLYRQIRIEGTVEQVTAQESDDYFKTRPRGSQIGAHISPQSQIIPNRDFLETRFQEYEARFKDQEISRPENWGGFRIVPTSFEFWEGKLNRLHDRFRYNLENQEWVIHQLAP